MRFLVVPRVLATTVMLVCVSVVADVTGVVGGLVISKAALHLDPQQYLQHSFSALKLKDFITGLSKAAIFGVIISSLACYLGLSVTSGAEGVGVATTRTVVLTIVALITVDLMFTAAKDIEAAVEAENPESSEASAWEFTDPKKLFLISEILGRPPIHSGHA